MRVRSRMIHSAEGPRPGSSKSGIPKLLGDGALGLALAILMAAPAWPQEAPKDLGEKSIEDLMNIEVTSVSKKEQKLSRAASAVFVITQEDIRRSGATNIPDLLRMVPGLDVAQVNGSTWAISSRGFEQESANLLLVLIDGRTVYNPIFSGVFWDGQQVPLEIINRIEVIRGPGAAIWGANAVNGVINIITEKAADIQGGSISATGGTYEQGSGTAVFGGALGSNTHYRAFVNGFNRGNLLDAKGANGQDDWDVYRTGFRIDSKAGDKNAITFEGDAYRGSEGEVVPLVTSFQLPQPHIENLRLNLGGWDLLSRWDHTFSPTSQTTLQVYFDRTNHADPTYGEALETVDIDFQHHIGWGDRQDFVWGLGYRINSDDIRGSFRVSFVPPSDTDWLFNAFVQDEISLIPQRLYLTLGTRLEDNSVTGFGVQPNARVAWLANDKNMFWAAVSRALHTPARDEDVHYNQSVSPGPGGLPFVVRVVGSNEADERVVATEIGYRTQISQHASLDLTAFYNSYKNLIAEQIGTPFLETTPAPLHLVLPVSGGNLMDGEGHGVEMAMNWKPTSRWTISPGYSYLQLHMHVLSPAATPSSATAVEGDSPREQAQLRSHFELSSRWAWDASIYFVGRLPDLRVPSYTRLDTGLTWSLRKKVSLNVVGQNLLRDHHFESNAPDGLIEPSQIKRSVYARLTWRY